MSKPNIESIYVLYWEHSKKSYIRNTFTNEIEKFANDYLSAAIKQRGFDFLMVNINFRTIDYKKYNYIIDKYAGQKRQRWPLIVINKQEFLPIDSSFALRRAEKVFKSVYEQYYGEVSA